MIGTVIQNLVGENQDQVSELFFEVLVFPYPVQVGIRFEDMQVGIHCFFLILILVAESHILYQFPVFRKGFHITVLFRVETILFDRLEETDRIIQRLFISGSPVILA